MTRWHRRRWRHQTARRINERLGHKKTYKRDDGANLSGFITQIVNSRLTRPRSAKKGQPVSAGERRGRQVEAGTNGVLLGAQYHRQLFGGSLGRPRAQNAVDRADAGRLLAYSYTSIIFITPIQLILFFLPSPIKRSRISHAKMVGLSRLYCSILATTSGVATLGLVPDWLCGLG